MCAEGPIRDHDDHPRRAGCENLGMSDPFDVVAWTQFNRRYAWPIDLEVVGFHFQCMDARTVCVNTQREFVGECGLHGDIEIKGPAGSPMIP